MKKLLFIIYAAFTFISCNHSHENNHKSSIQSDTIDNHHPTSSDSLKKDTLLKHETYPNSPKISSLPFGCSMLLSHKFPERWEVEYYTDPNSSYEPHVKEMYDIYSCFHKINAAKSFPLPAINKFELVKTRDEIKINKVLTDLLYNSIDSCKYRLPDFGPYECYYILIKPLDYGAFEDSTSKFYKLKYDQYFGFKQYFMDAGFLLFYKRADRSAKILNVYFSLVTEVSTSYSLFYIKEDKSIHLFDSFGDEAEEGLAKRSIVTVGNDGRISIQRN